MSVENPYNRLKRIACDYVASVIGRKRTTMFHYPADKVNGGSSWTLENLAQRVQAAQQLNHDVQIRWRDDTGLIVEYVERVDPPEFY